MGTENKLVEGSMTDYESLSAQQKMVTLGFLLRLLTDKKEEFSNCATAAPNGQMITFEDAVSVYGEMMSRVCEPRIYGMP